MIESVPPATEVSGEVRYPCGRPCVRDAFGWEA